MYLPIDKLIERTSDGTSQSRLQDLLPDSQNFPRSPESASRDRTDSRMRGVR